MKYEEYLENYYGLPVNIYTEDGQDLIFENVEPLRQLHNPARIKTTDDGKQFWFPVSDTKGYSFPLGCEYELVDDTWYDAQY